MLQTAETDTRTDISAGLERYMIFINTKYLSAKHLFLLAFL